LVGHRLEKVGSDGGGTKDHIRKIQQTGARKKAKKVAYFRGRRDPTVYQELQRPPTI